MNSDSYIPFISVIIPSFNSGNTIIQSVSSVIRELESVICDWEIIIIDDGSSDNSYDILEDFISKNEYARIKVIRQDNKGVASARNAGLKLAVGDLIAFNDSDDEWLKGKLECQIGVLNADTSVVMVGGMHENVRFSRLWKRQGALAEISLKKMIFKFYFARQGVLFKNSILEKTGLFDPNQRNAEEGVFFYRMTYFAKCVLVNKILTRNIVGKKTWGESGLSGQIHRQSFGELKNLTTIFKEGLINWFLFISALMFSLIKYIRRIIIYYFSLIVRYISSLK